MGILYGGKGFNGSRPCGSEELTGVHLLSIENNLQVFLPYGSFGHFFYQQPPEPNQHL